MTSATPWTPRRSAPSVGHPNTTSTRRWRRRWPGTWRTGGGGRRSNPANSPHITRSSTRTGWRVRRLPREKQPVMARVALIGSTGQLGSDIARLWPESGLARRGDDLIELTHADVEVTDQESVRSVLIGVQPSLVINTAAYIRVDDAETDTINAFMVNGMGS